MPSLHPQIREVLRAMAEAKLRPVEEMTPAEAREQVEATARARKAEPLPVARVEERMIPGPAGEIRLRLYWPRAAAPVPAIVYYHGGGHVIGSLDTHDFVARNLCSGVGALVASVDYRMGPEHKFPAAVDDSWAALQWVDANAASLGADPARMGVHGDSAGANLAAVVALLARDAGGPRLRLQSLVYPITDYGLVGDSYEKYANGYGILTRGAMVWFRDHYLRSPRGRERLARLADQGGQPRRSGARHCHHRGMRRAARRRSALCRGVATRRRAGRVQGVPRHDPCLLWHGAGGRRCDERTAPGLGGVQTGFRSRLTYPALQRAGVADIAVNPAKIQPGGRPRPQKPSLFDRHQRQITARNSEQEQRKTASKQQR